MVYPLKPKISMVQKKDKRIPLLKCHTCISAKKYKAIIDSYFGDTPMHIIKLDGMPVVKTPHNVAVKPIYSFEHATVVHIELKPGETLKKHITPVDVLFYVLEGEGEITIGDETQKIRINELIVSPKKIPHQLGNTSSQTFRFLVIKVPKPIEETKIL